MKPEVQKIILEMRQQGCSYTEIGDSLLLSPNTVKSICRRKDTKRKFKEKPTSDVCKNCGSPLKHLPGHRKKMFCSDRCRYTWWNKKRHKRPYRLICQCCGKEFVSIGNKKRRFCGRECYILSRYGEGVP